MIAVIITAIIGNHRNHSQEKEVKKNGRKSNEVRNQKAEGLSLFHRQEGRYFQSKNGPGQKEKETPQIRCNLVAVADPHLLRVS
jgi:hypothetical protein